MTIRQQWTIVGVVVLALAGGVFAMTRTLGQEMFPVSVGAPAPDFKATVIRLAEPRPGDASPPAVVVAGGSAATPASVFTRTLRDYKGQVVVLNIWATWCPPCREEMPSIQRLYAQYEREGLKVVAVSIDAPGQDALIRDFVRQYGLTFDVLHDERGAIQRDYQTTGVPETFVLGRDGLIRKKVAMGINWDSDANRALVTQLLAEPKS